MPRNDNPPRTAPGTHPHARRLWRLSLPARPPRASRHACTPTHPHTPHPHPRPLPPLRAATNAQPHTRSALRSSASARAHTRPRTRCGMVSKQLHKTVRPRSARCPHWECCGTPQPGGLSPRKKHATSEDGQKSKKYQSAKRLFFNIR